VLLVCIWLGRLSMVNLGEHFGVSAVMMQPGVCHALGMRRHVHDAAVGRVSTRRATRGVCRCCFSQPGCRVPRSKLTVPPPLYSCKRPLLQP
jgi:hypothetical protein